MKKYLKKSRLLVFVLALLICFALGKEAKAAEEGTMISNAVKVNFGEQYFKYWTSSTDHLNHYSKFELSEAGIINIAATKPYDSEGEYGKLTFSLYNEDGELIWGSKCTKAVDGVLDSYNLYVGLDAGTYIMTIKPGFTVTSGLIETYYSVGYEATPYCEKESNEGLADATQLALGNNYTGYYGQDYFYDAGENDYYKVYMEEGKNYKIAMGNLSKLDSTTALIYLVDPDGNKDSIKSKLQKKVDADNMNYFIYNAETSGMHYIGLENYSGQQVKYTIGVSNFKKKAQTITTGANAYKKKVNAANFKLKAKAKGQLSYHSSNTSICTVYSDGEVHIWGIGKATITIKAKATDEYKAATKKVTVTVRPKNIQIKSVSNPKKKVLSVTWKMHTDVDGYQVQTATNKAFTNGKSTYKANKYNYTGMNISNMKKKTYWVRIRTYAKGEDGKTYYSDWSTAKKIKIKK